TAGYVFKEYTAAAVDTNAPATTAAEMRPVETPVTPAPAAEPAHPAPAPAKIVSTANRLNIRAIPGLNGRRVGQLSAGETATVLETKDEWLRIEKPDGTAGYVFKEYTAAVTEAAAESGKPPVMETETDEAIAGFEESRANTSPAPPLASVLAGFDDEPVHETTESPDNALAAAPAGSGGDEDAPLPGSARAGRLSDVVWRMSGDITLSGICNVGHEAPDPGDTDHRGLSQLRAGLDLALETDLSDAWRCKVGGKGFHDFAYAINGRDEFPPQVLNAYESEAELAEAYIEGKILPSLDLKAGRQIVVWGNSETFRVTDILNPIDNRVPGVTDIEDLRLPVAMANIGYYFGDYSLSAIAIPEMRFDKQPVTGNDFYPFDQALPEEDRPATDFSNTDLAMSLKGIFHRWDLSLYGAHFYNDQTHFETLGIRNVVVGQVPLPGGGFAPVIAQVPVFRQRHARLSMAGCSVNVARGSWLFKTEVAFTDGYKFNTTDDKKSQIKGLAGFEYSGLKDTLIVLELVQTHLFSHEDRMASFPDYAKENQFEAALRVSRDLMRDRLELVLLALARGDRAQEGAFERFTATYDITDDLALTAGCVFYQDGNSLVYDNIHDNNRVFMDLKYSF
ncbi:MAG: DUF1302 family protein, partial [Thermodesulfobacteriota bacterium]